MRPAEMLEGKALEGGWNVVNRLTRKPTATGGNFSTGYIVENADGRKGFLKAMDYTAAFQSANTAAALSAMTSAYLFEKNICAKCSSHHLRRVVHAIDSSFIQTDQGNPFSKVEYLIFELAKGDIRSHLDAQQRFDLAFVLRTLHHVAVGLEQLHRGVPSLPSLRLCSLFEFMAAANPLTCRFGNGWLGPGTQVGAVGYVPHGA
jgi:hypothetical protein